MNPLTSQLEQLEKGQLVRRASDEDVSYLFKHALTQEATYASLLMKNRREIHRHVAEAYERLYPDRLDEFATVLAQHYAEARDDTKTVEYAVRAGNFATQVNAQTEARLLYAQALDALARLADNDENRRRRMDTLISQVWVSSFADTPAVNLARADEAELLAHQLLASDPAVQRQLAQIYQLKGFMHQQRTWRSRWMLSSQKV